MGFIERTWRYLSAILSGERGVKSVVDVVHLGRLEASEGDFFEGRYKWVPKMLLFWL